MSNSNATPITSSSSTDKLIPVKVAVRIRPLVTREKYDLCNAECIKKIDGIPQLIFGKDKCFTYDYVFSKTSTQQEVYDQSVLPLLTPLFKGYNVTVLAYGQTGSGKTYTMGSVNALSNETDDSMGIIQRVYRDIFRKIGENKNKNLKFSVKVSFVEIYNENIKDLLNGDTNAEPLNIREENNLIKVVNLSEISVTNVKETKELLEKGSSLRAVGGTAMNDQSSRSHAIFTVTIEQLNESDNSLLKSKLHLVDLAGSERLSKTQAEGIRLQEGININLGLLALGNVICILGDDSHSSKNKHVPYRQSKLTRLLQDSLGKNSHTLMIACASPADCNMEETLNTLRYADRARKIKNRPIVNLDPQAAELQILRIQVQELKAKVYELTNGALNPCTKDSSTTNYASNFNNDLIKTLARKHNYASINNLSDENYRLLTELSDKEYIIDDLRAKLYDKCQKISRLDCDFKERDGEVLRLKSELEDRQRLSQIEREKLIFQFEGDLCAKDNIIKELNDRIEERCHAFNEKINQLNGEIVNKVEQLEDANMRTQMTYERQLMKLEEELKQRDKLVSDLRLQCDEKTKDYEEKFIYLANEISIKDDRIRVLEHDINELNHKKREECVHLNQIQNDYESFITKSNRKTIELRVKFENELKVKEEIISNQQSKIMRCENDMREKDKLIMDLQTRVDDMNLELNGKIKFLNLIILNQDNKLKEFEMACEESKRRLLELELYKERTSDLEYMGDRLKSTEKHNQSLEDRIKRVQMERDELQLKHNELQIKLATVSDELDNLLVKDRVNQSEIKRLKANDSNEIDKLMGDKHELQQELIYLNQNLVQIKEKTKNEIDLLSRENDVLKEELNNLQRRLETLNVDYVRSSKSLMDALSENKRLKIDYENQMYRLNEDRETLQTKYEQELKEKDDCLKRLELNNGDQTNHGYFENELIERDNLINELQKKFDEKCKEFTFKLSFLNDELLQIMKKMRN